MRNLKLENRSIDYNKLLEYGFIKKENNYTFKKKIYNDQFEVWVKFSDSEKNAKLIDLSNEDEYVLVDVQDAVGEFVGKVREEYECILEDIIEKCTNKEVFKNSQSKEIIKYIEEKYKDKLEFLWEKLSNNAVWRNKENNKWYGILLFVEESKLGIDSTKKIEIIDLRYQKETINEIIDNKKIYPGYHMNKKSWITIKMDNSVKTEKIFELIDNSYKLSFK